MFGSIALESENYKVLVHDISELISGFNLLFEYTLDNELTKKDYDDKRETLQTLRDKISLS
jgi:hypothetical protein